MEHVVILMLENGSFDHTVEAGEALVETWSLQADKGQYDIWVYGPNGFVREFRGHLGPEAAAVPRIALECDAPKRAIRVVLINRGQDPTSLTVRANAYRTDGPWAIQVTPHKQVVREWAPTGSHGWYDLTVLGAQFEEHFAGRMETEIRV